MGIDLTQRNLYIKRHSSHIAGTDAEADLTKEQYADTQAKIVMIRKLAKHLPLCEFLQAIDRADTIGPILDSRLWIQGHREMEKIRDLAKALRAFVALPLPAYAEESRDS